MHKGMWFLMAAVLALAAAAPAADFWAGLLTNGSFRLGGFTTGPSYNDGSNANSAGFQYADTDGTTGVGLVVQTEWAAGYQDGDDDWQEQGMTAGMSQVVANSGDGSAVGLQGGVAGQTQTNDCGTQSQYVGGVQYASVSTSEGGSAVVTQSATVVVYQSQECRPCADDSEDEQPDAD